MLRRYRSIRFALTVFALTLGVAVNAAATPITGSIAFSGRIAPTNYLTATSIDILDADPIIPGQNVGINCTVSTPCSGAYAVFNGVFGLPLATYNDFTFGAVAPGPASGSVTPLWSIPSFEVSPGVFRSFSFDLTNITEITRGTGGIVLTGFGIAHATGLDDTFANWSFSSDTSGGTFAFSSTTTAQGQPGGAVPEPGSMMLLGTGLLGLAAAARRRLAAK